MEEEAQLVGVADRRAIHADHQVAGFVGGDRIQPPHRDHLGLARGRRNQRCVTECFQDLSFAYMQLRSLRKAELYGRRALGLALRKQYTDIIKTCYYLLGEIHYLQGNERESDFYFGKLQEFYPDISCLAEFLKTFDVSKILNFKNPS